MIFSECASKSMDCIHSGCNGIHKCGGCSSVHVFLQCLTQNQSRCPKNQSRCPKWLLYSVWKLLSGSCLNVFYGCTYIMITFLDFFPWALNSFISVLIYKRDGLTITVPGMEMSHHMILIILSYPHPMSIYFFFSFKS